MAINGLDFLTTPFKGKPPATIVVAGDDSFLVRESTNRARTWALGDAVDEFTYVEHAGATAEFGAVLLDLETRPFIGDGRLVHVDDADQFVSRFRDQLVKWVENPAESAVLSLVVSSLDSRTKLAKSVETNGLVIDADSPREKQFVPWAIRRCKTQFGKTLEPAAAEYLIEMTGPNLGVVDRELAKLTAAADGEIVSFATVERLTVGTRAESAFKWLDLIFEGRVDLTLSFLSRQLTLGETEVGIIAMLSSQLRRMTKAARLFESGTPIESALKSIGTPDFFIQKTRGQMRLIGKDRLKRMYRRLLQADSDLKGGSGLSPRVVVERLLLDLVVKHRPSGDLRGPRSR